MFNQSLALATSAASNAATPRAARWRARALAVIAATAAALIVWVIAHPLLGIDLRIPMAGGTQTMQIGWGSVLVISLIASLVGWGLLAVLERFMLRARAAWMVIAPSMLLLSFAGPLFAAHGASTGTKTVLALMHVAVAAVLIPALAHSSSDRPEMTRSQGTQTTAGR